MPNEWRMLNTLYIVIQLKNVNLIVSENLSILYKFQLTSFLHESQYRRDNFELNLSSHDKINFSR